MKTSFKMETLYNPVTYNHELYDGLTDENERHTVERLVSNLRFIEREILHVADGSINISPTCAVFIRSYPLRL